MESFESFRQNGGKVFRVDSPNHHELNAPSLKEESEALDGLSNVFLPFYSPGGFSIF
jgi:hypothetical protein